MVPESPRLSVSISLFCVHGVSLYLVSRVQTSSSGSVILISMPGRVPLRAMVPALGFSCLDNLKLKP